MEFTLYSIMKEMQELRKELGEYHLFSKSQLYQFGTSLYLGLRRR